MPPPTTTTSNSSAARALRAEVRSSMGPGVSHDGRASPCGDSVAAVEVRPAGEDDFKAVCGLLAELGRPSVGDATRDACRAGFLADLADEAADHLLAVDDRGE